MNQILLKALLFGLTGITSIVGLAAAAQTERPLISKSTSSGFVMPQAMRSERCEVYADRVVISHSYGHVRETPGFETTETRQIAVSASITEVVQLAAGEAVETRGPVPCDMASTEIVAGTTLLYATGGCGADRQERNGPASAMLRELVDRFCPTTIDFFRPDKR